MTDLSLHLVFTAQAVQGQMLPGRSCAGVYPIHTEDSNMHLMRVAHPAQALPKP